MAEQLFNTDVLVRSGSAGYGKIGYDTGLFLGGLPVDEVNADVSLGWDHRGKLISIKSATTARTVTLPALSTDIDGVMYFIQRAGANTVHIVPTGSDVINGNAVQFDLETDLGWCIVTADDGAGSWRVLSVAGQTSIEITNTDNVTLSLTGTGKVSDPYSLSADVNISSDTSNLLRTGAQGLIVTVATDGTTIEGAGTADSPLRVKSIAITDVHVVNDITARDALTVETGDVAKVLDAGNGYPSTYIYDGSNWVEIQDQSDVHSVNGKTGVVSLALGDLVGVSVSNAANGQILTFDGTNWVAADLPVTAFVGLVTTAPGTTGVDLTHNLGVATVNYSARNTATDEYEIVTFKRKSDNVVTLLANSAIQYEVRLTK